jgi:hypothetical protein
MCAKHTPKVITVCYFQRALGTRSDLSLYTPRATQWMIQIATGFEVGVATGDATYRYVSEPNLRVSIGNTRNTFIKVVGAPL